MADALFRISIDLGHLIPPSAPLNRDTFPYLADAVELVTAAAHTRWVQFASGVPLPSGKVITPRSGEYGRSIMSRSLGDFASEVFSELPYAAQIETGTPARDMKKMLDSSLKVRLTKDGRRYLIIPFRHDSPNSVIGRSPMPVEVFRWWHQEHVIPSHVRSTYKRKSGTGAYDINTRQLITVPGWRYGHVGADGKKHKGFGTRLGMGDLQSMGFLSTDKVAKRLVGMINFRQPGGKGGGSQSKYLTFRVMMQGSKGWIAPAREGLYPARTTAEEIAPLANKVFEDAVTRDLQAMLGGG